MSYYRFKERPCPACGEVVHLPEGKVCHDCEGIIERSKKIIAEYESRVPQRIYFDNYKGLGIKRYGGEPTCSRLIDGHEVEGGVDSLVNAIRDPFHGRFSQAGSDTVNLYGDMTKVPEYNDRCWSVMMPVEAALAINALVKKIKAHAQACYDQGFRDGSNLLKRLGEGSITLNEFETVKAKAELKTKTDCEMVGFNEGASQ